MGVNYHLTYMLSVREVEKYIYIRLHVVHVCVITFKMGYGWAHKIRRNNNANYPILIVDKFLVRFYVGREIYVQVVPN